MRLSLTLYSAESFSLPITPPQTWARRAELSAAAASASSRIQQLGPQDLQRPSLFEVERPGVQTQTDCPVGLCSSVRPPFQPC